MQDVSERYMWPDEYSLLEPIGLLILAYPAVVALLICARV